MEKERKFLLNYSVWKDVKRTKKMTVSRQDSDTSYMSDVESEMVFEDKLEEQAMVELKKNKFREIFKQALNAGAEYPLGRDKDYIYQQDLITKHEVVLPLPCKITNGVLALSSYTLSIGQCQALAQVFN